MPTQAHICTTHTHTGVHAHTSSYMCHTHTCTWAHARAISYIHQRHMHMCIHHTHAHTSSYVHYTHTLTNKKVKLRGRTKSIRKEGNPTATISWHDKEWGQYTARHTSFVWGWIDVRGLATEEGCQGWFCLHTITDGEKKWGELTQVAASWNHNSAAHRKSAVCLPNLPQQWGTLQDC